MRNTKVVFPHTFVFQPLTPPYLRICIRWSCTLSSYDVFQFVFCHSEEYRHLIYCRIPFYRMIRVTIT